jgi:hypothetical protein
MWGGTGTRLWPVSRASVPKQFQAFRFDAATQHSYVDGPWGFYRSIISSERFTCGERVFILDENQSTYIPQGEMHRLENPGRIPFEVPSGANLGEDDIIPGGRRLRRHKSCVCRQGSPKKLARFRIPRPIQ